MLSLLLVLGAVAVVVAVVAGGGEFQCRACPKRRRCWRRCPAYALACFPSARPDGSYAGQSSLRIPLLLFTLTAPSGGGGGGGGVTRVILPPPLWLLLLL